jgi:arylsulfatase
MGGMEPDRRVPGYRGNINRQCVTIAEALKHNGYAAYMSGKWHLTRNVGGGTEKDRFNWPLQRGFDRYYGIIRGASSFFTPKSLTRDNTNIDKEAKDDPDYYFTDAVSDSAVEFINDHCRKTPDKPFFSYVAYTCPHWPLMARDRDIARYKGRYDAGWDALRKERHERMVKMGIIDKKWPLSPRDRRVLPWEKAEASAVGGKVEEALKLTGGTLQAEMARKMEVYAAMLDNMDQGIGRIVDALEKNGKLDNTLILFLSDNGGCDEWGSYGFGWNRLKQNKALAGTRHSSISYGPAWAHVSNTPFRWYKLYVHEGGIATPLIAHWPARIKEKGVLRRDVSHIIDVMPTCLEAAGGTYPAEYAGNRIQPMEGVSLLPVFEGKALERKGPIFWDHIGNRAVRDGKWKLVSLKRNRDRWELYDMEADRTEMNDLAARHPDVVKRLDAAWQAWAKRCNVFPRRAPGRKK